LALRQADGMRHDPTLDRSPPASRPSLPTILLRLEGLALFTAASAAFLIGGGGPWTLLAWLLAPDLAALGYLAGRRVGIVLYDLVHATPGPLALLVLGLALDAPPAWLAATVWLAHIGMDRAVGYGLESSAEATA
jgi:hypothetical protein